MEKKRLSNKTVDEETIVAISTPLGIGGIGIVRMSGSRSIGIASKVFYHKGKTKINPDEFCSHHLYYGTVVQPGRKKMVDEVMLVVMRNPHSYTREDMVEIHCHGGLFVVQKVLEITVKLGARIAEPGEFTKLAFLNGRIDLSQAEAVIDIIESNNENSLKASLYHLSGGLKEKINHLRNQVVDLKVKIEAPMDFPDQGIAGLKRPEIMQALNHCLMEIKQLSDTARYGRMIKEGIQTIILGKTNVGKSSLFNTLLKQNRSIVTSLPGTTRDIIQESVNINGFNFNLMDTAGIKNPDNVVEQISLKRVDQMMQYAQLFIVMFDISCPLNEEDFELIQKIQSFINRNIKIILVVNKIDLPRKMNLSDLQQKFNHTDLIRISAKKKIGIKLLEKKMVNLILSDTTIPKEGLMISNQRQQVLLLEAQERLLHVISGTSEGIPDDFIVMDLQYIINQLAKIIGESCDEEMINRIFTRFCIGK